MHRFHPRKPRITPALVISMLALFVALTAPGFAQNIVPLAKRALTADKAKTANTAKVATLAKTANTAKTADTATTAQTANVAVDAQTLGGQTAAQIAGDGWARRARSPVRRSRCARRAGVLRTRATGPRNESLCNTGEKAVGGGWDMPNGHANPTSDAPLADLSGWVFSTWALSGNNVPANGSVWVVCAKVELAVRSLPGGGFGPPPASSDSRAAHRVASRA